MDKNDVEQLEVLPISDGNSKCHCNFGKQFGFLIQLNIPHAIQSIMFTLFFIQKL